MSIKKKIILSIKIFLALILFYIIQAVVYGTLTDFRPEPTEKLSINENAGISLVADTLTFAAYNIGYGGLGAESSFFYDDGRMMTSGNKMVRAPKKIVEKNIEGAVNFIKTHPVDFYLFQEVDKNSKRSYRVNQHEIFTDILPDYSNTFATNYKVNRVPLPLAEPFNVMGKIHSGLATYSRYRPSSASRENLPGNYAWPNNIFHLDRCLAVHRYSTTTSKELIVINTHNSAYDPGGILKKQEMAFLKELVLEEYGKGNYVIIGGDWNQCPPNFSFNHFRPDIFPEEYYRINIPEDFLPDDWTWVYDENIPTNRELAEVYRDRESETFVTLIDYFLVSPNVKVLNVESVDFDFEYADHQPVTMKIVLK